MDADSAPFHAALAEHRIVLQRCDGCGRHRFPPMPTCPWCGDRAATEVESPGTGRIYSWVTVHRALTATMADQVPYTIATVALDEGCRMFGRLAEATPVEAEAAVEPVFVDHPDRTELRFRVVRP